MEHALHDPTCKAGDVLEPTCGRGYMAETLREYFNVVTFSDKYAYGYGPLRDFLEEPYAKRSVDWVITNPAFHLAEAFVLQGLRVARRGVAILERGNFVESRGRYERLFLPYPPSIVATFVERVPMVQGRIDKHASTATSYAWFIWKRGHAGQTRHTWIRPCRDELERDGDYDLPTSRIAGEPSG